MSALDFRAATRDDIGAIVELLPDDPLGADARGSGIGAELITGAVEDSRRLGCSLVQLTSDATRTEAHRHSERLRFTASHGGFKRAIG